MLESTVHKPKHMQEIRIHVHDAWSRLLGNSLLGPLGVCGTNLDGGVSLPDSDQQFDLCFNPKTSLPPSFFLLCHNWTIATCRPSTHQRETVAYTFITFGKGVTNQVFLHRHLPMSLKWKVFNQCVLPAMTYGCQTWSLTKALVKKLEMSQQAMERKMFHVELKDRFCNTITRQRSRVTDIVQYVTNTKWKWAGHIAWMKDNRWTVRSRVADKGCKISRMTKTSLERWHCGATGSGMDKNSKGQRKMEDSRRATSCSGRTQPRIEQNRIE